MSFWHHLIDVLLHWGPYGLLLLSLLDSTGLPVVGGVDALLVAVATDRPEHAYLAAGCAIIGSVVGSLILFSVARKGGEVLLARYISGGTGARMHDWFQRYGLATVFVPAVSPLPLPMKVPVFCAGALNVRLTYFLFVVITARVIRYIALAHLGRQYGRDTGLFLKQHWVGLVISSVVFAVVLTAGLRAYQRHRVSLGEAE